MKDFRLTIKRLDNSEEFQDLSNKIMKCLYKDFDLEDEPEFCNTTLLDLLGLELTDLAVMVSGNDYPSTVERLGSLILVGDQYGVSDDFCPECGFPEYSYTGGRMLCLQCEHSEEAPENYLEGDIADMSGFVVINKNQIR